MALVVDVDTHTMDDAWLVDDAMVWLSYVLRPTVCLRSCLSCSAWHQNERTNEIESSA
jgi:hypothetical protein